MLKDGMYRISLSRNWMHFGTLSREKRMTDEEESFNLEFRLVFEKR
jgi:hypothetical protein